MEYTKKFKAYVLVDPNTRVPRYVGITTKSLKVRFAGHLRDVYHRPDLNKHKTNWFKSLLSQNKMPEIQQIAEFDNEIEMKQFEKDYIAQYKTLYDLINQTPGGDWIGNQAHSRESILKKSNTRAVVQYNVLGEKIAEFEITEDIMRAYNLRNKACSHITQCCKGTRSSAYGYIWTYKNAAIPDFSKIDATSVSFNKIVQYDANGHRIAEFESYATASAAIGDNSNGSNIRAVIIGMQKSCKGFYFQLEPTYVYFDQALFEKRLKQSQQLSKPQFNPNSTKVLQYTLSGDFVAEYNSLSAASIAVLGTQNGRKKIKECCEGTRTDYKKFIWKYKTGPL